MASGQNPEESEEWDLYYRKEKLSSRQQSKVKTRKQEGIWCLWKIKEEVTSGGLEKQEGAGESNKVG